jgi:parallel beta-helix repeat protein
MKKVGTLWILLLIALLSLPSTTGFFLEDHQPLSQHVITVDDEPGDADYTSIKEALNHSSPGDTIEVFSGTYFEHDIIITLNGISLVGMPYELGNGSDTGKPFINGQGLGDIINIKNAKNVTITGFRIENRGEGYFCIILVGWGSDGCVIANNTLRYTGNSIIGCSSNFSKFTNNTIRDAGGLYGILLGYHNNIVSDNIIDHCPRGISFWGASFNTITRNRISNCSQFGIDIMNTGNVIQFNTIENNAYGVHINTAGSTRITQNNFINNTRQAGFDQNINFIEGNRWSQNYWNRPRLLPYPIRGTVFLIVPWMQFDWRPAQTPFEITP